MSHDALIEALSGTIETLDDGSTIYRNSAGDRHRVGGPALLHYTGSRVWHQNGLRHRTDGPAIEYSDGTKCWYLYDVEYAESEYYTALAQLRNNHAH